MDVAEIRSEWVGQVVDEKFAQLEWLGSTNESAASSDMNSETAEPMSHPLKNTLAIDHSPGIARHKNSRDIAHR
jgi:hypothetical protein